jgi:hypothetical protein
MLQQDQLQHQIGSGKTNDDEIFARDNGCCVSTRHDHCRCRCRNQTLVTLESLNIGRYCHHAGSLSSFFAVQQCLLVFNKASSHDVALFVIIMCMRLRVQVGRQTDTKTILSVTHLDRSSQPTHPQLDTNDGHGTIKCEPAPKRKNRD